jgi:hypothetical protein
MSKSVTIFVMILCFYGLSTGKDNRISFTFGIPDQLGLEYQHYFNNFYIGFSPHILIAALESKPINSIGYDWAIFPNISVGYIFFKKGKFDLGTDLIITPAYFVKSFEEIPHDNSFELWTGLRLVPSLTFSKITISICGGIGMVNVIWPFKMLSYSAGLNYLIPSLAIKVGFNF